MPDSSTLTNTNTMIAKITKAYTRTYGDTGQTAAYVEWRDENGRTGRTEGGRYNRHMAELFRRAAREGVKETHETWKHHANP